MIDDQTGRLVDSKLAMLVRDLALANPSKSVSLTVCHLLHHSSPSLHMQWRLEIGHNPAATAFTYEEVVALEKKQQAPEHKLERAAKLRQEADQLEEAARLQSATPTSTAPEHG